ncbi:hypothetical protein [Bradyrhizobium stylosanthis]|nr:hypothetical protein [Bradyrhizobium stylosanthis]
MLRPMVALDDVRKARVENAHIARLEELVENVRATLAGPASDRDKIGWITELLNVQGYRIDAPG